MTQGGDTMIALPPAAAARLAGISTRKLTYWRQIRLIVPSIQAQITPGRIIRLYQLPELVELLVAAMLRNHLTLQHIRRVVGYLRTQGYTAPLRELCYAVDAEELYFKHPDGSWEGDKRPGQTVARVVIPLEEIRARIVADTRRRPEEHGRVIRRRGVMGGKEVFAGTRVPVATVEGRLRLGQSTTKILEAFPALHEADIATARSRISAA